MKKRSFAAFCMRLRMRFLAWRAQRRGELPPDEVFFYRFNQREGLNTRKRAFWAAQAQLVEMGGALPRPARQAYMPASEAQAYAVCTRQGSALPQAFTADGRQGIALPQAFAADDRQGSALPQTFAADDRQGLYKV